jgi:hypothetical protein
MDSMQQRPVGGSERFFVPTGTRRSSQQRASKTFPAARPHDLPPTGASTLDEENEGLASEVILAKDLPEISTTNEGCEAGAKSKHKMSKVARGVLKFFR